MKKYDIVNALVRRHELTSCLVLLTPTTGGVMPGEATLDETALRVLDRFAYRSTDAFRAGIPSAIHSDNLSSRELFAEAIAKGNRYQIVFVDSHHAYESTQEDLACTASILAPDGIIVVHDCNPPRFAVSRSNQGSRSEWCGVTYAAFIDFVAAEPGVRYFTVDCDYGCGVIYSGDDRRAPSFARKEPPLEVMPGWRKANRGDWSRYRYLNRNRQALLNLVTPATFQAFAEAA